MTSASIIDSWEEISPFDLPDWDDKIKLYNSKYLFHETCWLRFLERSQGAKIHGLKLLDADGGVVGYFCAGEVRKGPFRLLGSPLQGWTTNYMGPIVNEVDIPSFLRVLERYCEAKGIDYLELSNPVLSASAMSVVGYESDHDITFLVATDDETAMWNGLKSECRNRIRRGVKNNLQVERATDGGFVQEYYGQLKDVFSRQNLVPTYGEERVLALRETLMPVGRLLTLRIRQAGDVVATGVFPHDERAIYFWGGASWTSAYSLYPNELLHWSAMLFALENGILTYNMTGGGSFKPKFGGVQVAVERWYKPLSPFARVGRIAFKQYFRTRQRLSGQWRRILKKPSATDMAVR